MDLRIHKAHRATIKLTRSLLLRKTLSPGSVSSLSESKEAFSKNLEKLRLESGDSIKVRSDHRLRIVSIRCADTFIQKLEKKLKCRLDFNQKITENFRIKGAGSPYFCPGALNLGPGLIKDILTIC